MKSRQAIFLFLALTTASWGYAASVATLSCTGNQAVSINLSYFAVGATLTSPPANSNAVQNDVMPLTLHAALSSYSTLFQAVAAGVPFSSCTLNTLGSNGGAIQFTFNTVYVSTLTAVATSANSMSGRTAYVDATLLFSGVAVTQAGNTIDDGGTSTPPGWDLGANKSS
jgi:ABC-type maltose transport system permease subunit